MDTLFFKKGHTTNDKLYNVEDEEDDVLDEQMY